MNYKRINNRILLSLQRNDKIFESINEVVNEENLKDYVLKIENN